MRLKRALQASSIISMLMLAGCAGQQAAREVSGTSASLVQDMQTSVARLAKAENTLNQKNEAQLARQQAEANLITSGAGARLGAWRAAGDEEAEKIFTGAPRATGQEILTQTGALAAGSTISVKPLPTPDADSVEAVVQALNKLSDKPSFTDRMAVLIDFGKEVQAAYVKDADKTKTSVEESADKKISATE